MSTPLRPDASASVEHRLRDLRAFVAHHPEHRAAADWVEAALAKIDLRAQEALQRHYAEQVLLARSRPWSKHKYVDIVCFLFSKYRLAVELGLDRADRPLRILDLGAGGCHFGFVCRELGHDVVNLDIKFHVYESIAALLGTDRVRAKIDPGVRLPDLGGRFDLVTSVAIYFNKIRPRNRAKPYWSVDDWAFLANDLIENHLRTPGGIWFWMNHETIDGRRHLNPHVMDLFERHGGIVNRTRGTLDLPVAGPMTLRPRDG